MARLCDSHGTLLGGIKTLALPFACLYGPMEIIPGLRCQCGSAAESLRPACRTLVETPDTRHHCHGCGGDHCAAHADPAAHECRALERAV